MSLDALLEALQRVDAAARVGRPAGVHTPQQQPGKSAQGAGKSHKHGKKRGGGDKSAQRAPGDAAPRQGGAASKSGGGHRQPGASASALESEFDEINIDAYHNNSAAVSATAMSFTRSGNVFLVDSGATHHCVRSKALFTDVRPTRTVVKVANGKSVVAEGRGTVELQVESDKPGVPCKITLHNVLFTPGLANNIFSTNQFVAADPANGVVMSGVKAELRVQGVATIPLLSNGGLLHLVVLSSKLKTQRSAVKAGDGPSVSLQKLHERPRLHWAHNLLRP